MRLAMPATTTSSASLGAFPTDVWMIDGDLRFGTDNYGFLYWLENDVSVGYFFGDGVQRVVKNPVAVRIERNVLLPSSNASSCSSGDARVVGPPSATTTSSGWIA